MNTQESLSIVERANKRFKSADFSSQGDYVDTRLVVPASNLCERLFSKTGYALSARWRGISPARLEEQILFLHVNNDPRTIDDVNEILE